VAGGEREQGDRVGAVIPGVGGGGESGAAQLPAACTGGFGEFQLVAPRAVLVAPGSGGAAQVGAAVAESAAAVVAGVQAESTGDMRLACSNERSPLWPSTQGRRIHGRR
jgi:hypothetical protein